MTCGQVHLLPALWLHPGMWLGSSPFVSSVGSSPLHSTCPTPPHPCYPAFASFALPHLSFLSLARPEPVGAAARLDSQVVLLLELSRWSSLAFCLHCPTTYGSSYVCLGAHKRSKDLTAPKQRRLVFTNTGLTHTYAMHKLSIPTQLSIHTERTYLPRDEHSQVP